MFSGLFRLVIRLHVMEGKMDKPKREEKASDRESDPYEARAMSHDYEQ
jgi:hypothetical protein